MTKNMKETRTDLDFLRYIRLFQAKYGRLPTYNLACRQHGWSANRTAMIRYERLHQLGHIDQVTLVGMRPFWRLVDRS